MSTSMLIIVGMAICVLAVILYPLFIDTGRQKGDFIEKSDWEQRKEEVFLQLSDLEYDYQMGKLSQHDYETTKAELTAVAVRYTREEETDLDNVSQSVDQEIEHYLSARGVQNEH
ncbi:hypothetical protein B0W44_07935 [Novibacillus thermophilus]|uniref:C-type cytochrome biogenesis protein CcmI n=2 Tax=Novibacillus thermophilus TaxID=1471761 RepID=A0A1U9K6U4_9BACL|nr:hypothetical protein B0W44_07935 [Novibacillus thermophilus]